MNAVDVAIEWHPVGKSSAKISTQIGGYDEVDQLIKSFHRIFFSRYWLITAYADKLHAFWHWCEAHIVSTSEKFHFFRKVKVVNSNNLMRFKVMRVWYELYSLRCWIDGQFLPSACQMTSIHTHWDWVAIIRNRASHDCRLLFRCHFLLTVCCLALPLLSSWWHRIYGITRWKHEDARSFVPMYWVTHSHQMVE